MNRVLATLNSNASYKLKVKGYMMLRSDEMSNLNLSLRRAQNVWKYIQSKDDGSKVELYGF
ncbi:MAG: OmpA family protein [Chitinophagales bacterium]